MSNDQMLIEIKRHQEMINVIQNTPRGMNPGISSGGNDEDNTLEENPANP
jgi:hypothetical protein